MRLQETKHDLYCAMLEPGAWPCVGCSMVTDNIGYNLPHVNARGTTFVFTSLAPQDQITDLQQRMGWHAPWYTDHGRRFADAFDAGTGFAVNVLIRDDAGGVYRTYFTTNRGGDLFDTNLISSQNQTVTPYGEASWFYVRTDAPRSLQVRLA